MLGGRVQIKLILKVFIVSNTWGEKERELNIVLKEKCINGFYCQNDVAV